MGCTSHTYFEKYFAGWDRLTEDKNRLQKHQRVGCIKRDGRNYAYTSHVPWRTAKKNADTSRIKRDKIFHTSSFHIDKHGWSSKQIYVSTIMFNRSGNLSDAHAQTVRTGREKSMKSARKSHVREVSESVLPFAQDFHSTGRWAKNKKKRAVSERGQ